MKKNNKGKKHYLILLTLLLTVLSGTAYATISHGCDDSGYQTVSTVPAVGTCTSMQGMTTSSTYSYSIKINSYCSQSVIYRTSLSGGSSFAMTNSDNNTQYCSYLSHANDMAYCTVDGKEYLFVVTTQKGTYSLIKFEINGNCYKKVGSYRILAFDGANWSPKGMSGIAVSSVGPRVFNLLMKSGNRFFICTLDRERNSGDAYAQNHCILNRNVRVEGSYVSGIQNYNSQGFCYYNGSLYVPVTKGNTSVVLVYQNIMTRKTTAYASSSLSFKITSSAYKQLEVESCSVVNNRLYFSYNSTTYTTYKQYDGIGYFNCCRP